MGRRGPAGAQRSRRRPARARSRGDTCVNGTAMDDLPTIDTDVLVVGAGPTGLMAGLVLARRGVPVVVVDRKAAPTRESRALAVQARTMEIYDQLGIVGTVLDGSHGVTRIQIGQGADRRKFSI